jgi:uncharacterized OB-fold protein
MAAVRSIAPDAFAVHDDGRVALLGGFSPSSGQYHFPRADTCPYSGATDIEPVEFDGAATLWGWTAVTTATPGYNGAVPYGFGVVEFAAQGIRLITRLTEADPSRLTFGQTMVLCADIVATDDDGTAIAAWAFAPIAAGATP